MEDRRSILLLVLLMKEDLLSILKKKAQEVEKRLIPLLKGENSPYSRFIMRVPGFGVPRILIIVLL